MKTFVSDANCAMQEKGYKKHCHPLDALSKIVETNSKSTTAEIHFYKWSGFCLLTPMPLISALRSVFVRQPCLIGIRIDRYKAYFLMALERLPKIDSSFLHELADNKRKEFEKYQEELIGLFMPMEIGIYQDVPNAVLRHEGRSWVS